MTNQAALPYSVFTENRPLRIAFLVNPNDKKAFRAVEHIITYNQGKWGGRFNPIILTNGKTINKKWWQFLKEYDPDIIKSYVAISKPLLRRINNHLTPYLVEDYMPPRRGSHFTLVHLDDEGLSVLPTKENIAQVTGFSLERTFLVLFEIDQHKNSYINTFLKVNFGTYKPRLATSEITRQFPNRKEFTIKKKKELTDSLSQLNTFDTFVYPSQMCSFPPTSLNIDHNYLEEAFNVVVGDSLNDIVLYWNRIFSVSDFRQTRLNSLWISKKMATDEKIVAALKTWIKRAVNPSGGQDKDVRFISTSLEKNELTDIATKVLDQTYFRRTVASLKDLVPPTLSQSKYLPPIKERLPQTRVTGEEAYISVAPPSLVEGVMGGEHWMTDVYIEFRPERFTYIYGDNNYWWQLPRHNDLALNMFHTPSRICGNGIPSVLLQRDRPLISPFLNNRFQIKLPDDRSIFQTLIVGEKRPIYNSDPREGFSHRPYNNTLRSDKGKYLSGFVDLFSSLHEAHSLLKNRYWRKMFDTLSQQNPQKDEQKREMIGNTLKKQLLKRDLTSIDGKQWLTDFILRISKEQSSAGKELPYSTFENVAKAELAEYNSKHRGDNNFSFDEQELKKKLAWLINLGVLLIGIKPRCPHCGLASWNHIDEIKQQIKCKGCGYQFGISPEEIWYYRMNSLIQVGVSRHYLIPVILTLGQLLDDARSSFICTTSLELFTRRSYINPKGELDIVCIQDGDFIIGEVKNTCKLFEKSDFLKMEKIAKKIMPNKVIFSSLNKEPSPFVKKQIQDMSKRLSSLDIKVEWYPFSNWIFEAEPRQ